MYIVNHVYICIYIYICVDIYICNNTCKYYVILAKPWPWSFVFVPAVCAQASSVACTLLS